MNEHDSGWKLMANLNIYHNFNLIFVTCMYLANQPLRDSLIIYGRGM